MKIAINTLALSKTKVGMGRYIVNLVEEVTIQDNIEWYIFVYKSTKHFFPERNNIHYIILPDFFFNTYSRLFFEQCVLPVYLMKHKIALYHNPGFSLPLYCPCRSVVTIADMTFFSHPQHHLSKKNLYFQLMIPCAIKKADAVIAISENTKEDILKYFPAVSPKVYAISLAVDSIFKPYPQARAKSFLKKHYNISEDFVLFVGMLEPRKNIIGLLEAFSLIKTNQKLVIVGKKGWMYDEIFATIQKKKLTERVIFTRYVPDEHLPFFYSAATCFIYPSFYEGFGIPILEAMACGCPVITSNTSSMKEVAGGAAILVNPCSIDSIKNALQRLINNTHCQKTMKVKGLQHAKNFNWKIVGKKTIDIYFSVKKEGLTR